MKTFLEQLQESVGTKYPLRTMLDNLEDEQIIEEINIFAKSVAKQALENADKRVGAFPNYRNLVTDKITNPDNIPTI